MNAKDKRRESHAGFHFYNLFQNCPRKFYFKYCLRLVPKYSTYALIHGGAFHEGKATFYTSRSEKKALAKFEREVEEQAHKLEDENMADVMLDRGKKLLSSWIHTWGKQDLRTYKVFEVEAQHHLFLDEQENLYITVRPDTILADHKDQLIIMETKTSSFSVNVAATGVQAGDQATSYYAAVREHYPEYHVLYVQPDISYWNKRSENTSNITHFRADPVVRTDHEVDDWQQGLRYIIEDVSRRVELVKEGKASPYMLFPRNTSWCNSFSKPCEYIEICRQTKLTGKGRAPAGFKRDKRQRLAITDPVWEME